MTSSGLKIEKLAEGAGASPKAGDRVTVHDTGWLTDGRKFDSSVDRGQPFDDISIVVLAVLPTDRDERVRRMQVSFPMERVKNEE